MPRFALGLGLALAVINGGSMGPSTVFAGQDPPATQNGGSTKPGACVVRIGAVRDLRGDPGSMGALLTKTTHVTDSTAWVRAELLSLADDPHVRIAGDGEPATPDLILGVELVKAYLVSENMAKTAIVVLRVRWRRADGTEDSSIYRGSVTSINWISGETEIRGAFNRALSSLTDNLHRDLLSRCPPSSAPSP